MGIIVRRYLVPLLVLGALVLGAAKSGSIQYSAINGVTGALSYAPTTGVFSQASFSNVSGSVACGQMPALTGDVTTSAGSCATAYAGTITNEKCVTWDSTTSVTAQTIDFPVEWTTYTMTSVKAKVAGGGSFKTSQYNPS